MNVYQINHDGVFLGVVLADQDPMNEGNFLIPAGCVEIAPPDFSNEQFARWDGAEWTIEDMPAPEPQPEPTPIDPAEEARSKRDALLFECDWTQIVDAPVDQVMWANYRQLLRDVPAQSEFPQNINWPVQPE